MLLKFCLERPLFKYICGYLLKTNFSTQVFYNIFAHIRAQRQKLIFRGHGSQSGQHLCLLLVYLVVLPSAVLCPLPFKSTHPGREKSGNFTAFLALVSHPAWKLSMYPVFAQKVTDPQSSRCWGGGISGPCLIQNITKACDQTGDILRTLGTVLTPGSSYGM